MAKLKRPSKKFLAIIIALLIAVGLTGFAFWQNQLDDPLVKLSFLPGYIEPLECGEDAQCLFSAYNNDCRSATWQSSYDTTEGDPIITSVDLSKSDDNCVASVAIDSTQDSYASESSQIVRKYSCNTLIRELGTANILATDCSGEDSYEGMRIALL